MSYFEAVILGYKRRQCSSLYRAFTCGNIDIRIFYLLERYLGTDC